MRGWNGQSFSPSSFLIILKESNAPTTLPVLPVSMGGSDHLLPGNPRGLLLLSTIRKIVIIVEYNGGRVGDCIFFFILAFFLCIFSSALSVANLIRNKFYAIFGSNSINKHSLIIKEIIYRHLMYNV